ncbi:ATP-binding cassette sub-family G member 1 [Sergentomyia squamirostris]
MVEQGHIVNFANSEKLNISFRNLTYYATSGKKDKILKNISGTFETGRLCAILGPSGAGKTTLLNILSGLTKPAPDSTFLINDKCISKKYIRRKCSYIPQDITFEKRFTVLETLKFAADLKQPDFVSNEEKQVIVNNVIESLGLQKCADTFVEKLSGGERKRLAMGEELLSNPGLMILDEPTSGLDSVTTVQIVTCLRKIAQSGRTVICVIHQPSSNILDLFDDFYVLSDGQCLYYGPVVDVIPAFEAAGYHCPNYYNKADFVVEVASHERKGNMDFLISNAKNQHIIQNIEPKSNLWPSTTTLSTISYSVQSLTVSVHSECGTVQSLPESDNTINLADKKEMNNFTYPISRWKQYGILVRRGFLCQRRNFVSFLFSII